MSVGGVAYTLAYDAESRLTSVTGGTTNETYTYDGDGARLKVVSAPTSGPAVTTVYIGAHYEYTLTYTGNAPGGGEGTGGTPTPPTISTRSYYYAGGQRLAVRDSATGVAYLYGDHLGSANVAVSAAGAVVSRTRYKPWGETRHQSGAAVTDRLFTGQLWDGAAGSGGTGLYFYNARYYDPALGRFTQADTVVPEPGMPMAFDRYAYALNSPLVYADPSGHDPLDQTWRDEFCSAHFANKSDCVITYQDEQIRLFSLAYPDEWFGGFMDKFYTKGADGKLGLLNQDAYKSLFAGEVAVDSNRNWGNLPAALLRLSKFYAASEERWFVQDIALLYAGLPSRRESFEAWSIYGEGRPYYMYEPRGHLHIGPIGIDPQFYTHNNGVSHDTDYNVHHWAWAFAVGYNLGPAAATSINTIREKMAGNDRSDRLIGGAGAQMGWALASRKNGYAQLPALFEKWLYVQVK